MSQDPDGEKMCCPEGFKVGTSYKSLKPCPGLRRPVFSQRACFHGGWVGGWRPSAANKPWLEYTRTYLGSGPPTQDASWLGGRSKTYPCYHRCDVFFFPVVFFLFFQNRSMFFEFKCTQGVMLGTTSNAPVSWTHSKMV